MYRLTLRVRGEPTDSPKGSQGDTEWAPGLSKKETEDRAGQGLPEGLVPRSQDVCLGLDPRGRSGADREVVKRMRAGTLVLPGGLCRWLQL